MRLNDELASVIWASGIQLYERPERRRELFQAAPHVDQDRSRHQAQSVLNVLGLTERKIAAEVAGLLGERCLDPRPWERVEDIGNAVARRLLASSGEQTP